MIRHWISGLLVLYGSHAMAADPVQINPSRGELLYSTHCIACHTEQVHWREKKLVTDWPSLVAEVNRWQGIDKLGLPAEEFADRWNPASWPRLRARLEAVFRGRTRDEWCARLEGTDACVAPVLDLDEAPRHPHNVARQTFVEHAGVTQPAPAPRFSRTASEIQRAAAARGEHSEAILRDWGLEEHRIAELKACGAI